MANMTIQNVHSVRSTPPNDADMEHVKEYRKRVGENDDAIACYLPMGAGIATRYLVRPLSSLHYAHLVNLEVSVLEMMMLLLLYVRGCGVTEVEEILWSHQFIRRKKAL